MAVAKICPKCGGKSYSAAELDPWPCPYKDENGDPCNEDLTDGEVVKG